MRNIVKSRMKCSYVFITVILQLSGRLANAGSPGSELREMIVLDMAGDPSGRLVLAGKNAEVITSNRNQSDRQRVSFELDADTVGIATSWNFVGGSDQCASNICTIGVIYHVVATTTGNGVPSWDRPNGREIQPLSQTINRLVEYEISETSHNKWQISKFPMPYVDPYTLLKFFREEAQRANSLAGTTNDLALKNREIIRQWRQRQIDVLEKLCGNSSP